MGHKKSQGGTADELRELRAELCCCPRACTTQLHRNSTSGFCDFCFGDEDPELSCDCWWAHRHCCGGYPDRPARPDPSVERVHHEARAHRRQLRAERAQSRQGEQSTPLRLVHHWCRGKGLQDRLEQPREPSERESAGAGFAPGGAPGAHQSLIAVEKLEPGPCDGIADDVPMTGGLLDASELPSEQRAQASGRPWQERAALCACPRGCAMQLYPREGPVCDFCFVETEPQPNCGCADDCPCHRFWHDSDEDPDEASRDPDTVKAMVLPGSGPAMYRPRVVQP